MRTLSLYVSIVLVVLASCGDASLNDRVQRLTVGTCLAVETACVTDCTTSSVGIADCNAYCAARTSECCEDRGTAPSGESTYYIDGSCTDRHELLATPLVIDGVVQRCELDQDCDGADDCDGSPSFACCGDSDCNGLDDCNHQPRQDPACPAPCGDGDSDGFDDCATKLAVGSPPTGMVLVPAGLATVGCDFGVTPRCPMEDRYLDRVELSAFYIDTTEVTQSAYQGCIDAGACTAPSANFDPIGRPNHPVSTVTWNQADTYCGWAGKRLPTDSEWEKAARGPNGRTHPWGDGYDFGTVPPCSLGNWVASPTATCVGDTVAVGSYPGGASIYGALDMSGNVSEWVRDYMALRSTSTMFTSDNHPEHDPVRRTTDPNYGDQRVYRGGDWNTNPYFLIGSARRGAAPTAAAAERGFRCAKSNVCIPDLSCPANGLGQQCTTMRDGCGGVKDCGPVVACSGADTCGGGEVSSVCGCDPAAGTCGEDWGDTYVKGTGGAPYSIETDYAGNVYVGGVYRAYSGAKDTAWHASFTSTGVKRFDRGYGGSCTNYGGAFDIAVDQTSGSVFIAGAYANPGIGGARATLHKYDANGVVQWSHYFSGPAELPDERFFSVGVDSNGDVLVAGHYWCEADIGGGVLKAGSDCSNRFLFFAKYRSSDGAHLWSNTASESYWGFTVPSVVTPSGDLLVLARRGDTYGSGPGNKCNGHYYDRALVRLAGADGSMSLGKCFPQNVDNQHNYIDYIELSDVEVDSTGNVYILGKFYGERDFGGITETTGTTPSGGPIYEMFVAKLSPDLSTALWVARTSTTTPSGSLGWTLRDLEVDQSGNAYVLASVYINDQTVSLGGQTLGATEAADSLVFKLDSAGSVTGHGWLNNNQIKAFSIDKLTGKFLFTGGTAKLDEPYQIGDRVFAGGRGTFVARVPQAEILTGGAGCVPRTCSQAGAECDTVSDGCGGTLNCGTCGDGLTCDTAKKQCTCAVSACWGVECGISKSACRPINCGNCTGDLVCAGRGTANTCQDPNCTAATCGPSDCGTIPDGCGGNVDCGECPGVCGDGVCACSEAPASCSGDCEKVTGPGSGRFSCGNGTCESAENATSCPADCSAQGCACVPTTCAAQGATCGSISDGCGGTLSCGSCTSPETCGGGGTANVCGTCTPTTCAAQGANCGSISDGCGGTLSCGTCTSPDTCGGGGSANVCGSSSCGNSTCDVGESCDGRNATTSCIADCPGVVSGKPANRYCYVNGVCEGSGCP